MEGDGNDSVSKRRRFVVQHRPWILYFALLPVTTWGQVVLHELAPTDSGFVQLRAMVDSEERSLPLVIFSYPPTDTDTLTGIAREVGLPPRTIASLNRIALTDPLPELLYIPNQRGLFAFSDPATAFEQAAFDEIQHHESVTFSFSIGGEKTPVIFAPQLDFSPPGGNTLYGRAFSNPLPKGVVSSPYGQRIHPVTGRRAFHGGIDLAAPFGTPVYAAAEGTVESVARDAWLGLSVRINHHDGYQTVYAHLQEVTVTQGETIHDHTVVGYVGSTGMSTNAHLHFEVWFNRVRQDPGGYLQW